MSFAKGLSINYYCLSKDNGLATGNLGSYGTMAPETLEGKPYGLQADMFSVGVILYLMIFSKYPFNSCNKQIFLKEVKENSISNLDDFRSS